jgi:hypothetical protein
MIVTKNNQTPLELATEFVNNARNVKVPEEFVRIGKTAEAEEDGPSSERILQQIEHAGRNPNSKTNGREVKFLQNTHAKVSDALLSWICAQSDGNPAYINTVLGMYATVFYQYHTKDEVMTIKWLNNLIGAGKIFDFRNIYPYYAASLTADRISVYTLMQPEDLYLAG